MNPHNPKRPLAPTPRKILRLLVECSPRPLSTEQIADLLDADLERFSYANYRQHIKTLRRAFAAAEGDSGAAPVGRQRVRRGGSKGSIGGTAASTDAMANFDITKECVIAKEEEWQLLFGNR